LESAGSLFAFASFFFAGSLIGSLLVSLVVPFTGLSSAAVVAAVASGLTLSGFALSSLALSGLGFGVSTAAFR
jgi:hypothetical protein